MMEPCRRYLVRKYLILAISIADILSASQVEKFPLPDSYRRVSHCSPSSYSVKPHTGENPNHSRTGHDPDSR